MIVMLDVYKRQAMDNPMSIIVSSQTIKAANAILAADDRLNMAKNVTMKFDAKDSYQLEKELREVLDATSFQYNLLNKVKSYEESKIQALSLIHIFPIITGFPVSVALFASGIGTLIYVLCTKGKVPVYLGSSFAYISAVLIAKEAMGGDVSAAQTGLILVGLIYVAVAFIVKVIGKDWIDKLLPPIVIGPMIAVIGLGLAANAVGNAQFVEGGDWRGMLVAVATFIITALVSTKAKGFFKIIPFLVGICLLYTSRCV